MGSIFHDFFKIYSEPKTNIYIDKARTTSQTKEQNNAHEEDLVHIVKGLYMSTLRIQCMRLNKKYLLLCWTAQLCDLLHTCANLKFKVTKQWIISGVVVWGSKSCLINLM